MLQEELVSGRWVLTAVDGAAKQSLKIISDFCTKILKDIHRRSLLSVGYAKLNFKGTLRNASTVYWNT